MKEISNKLYKLVIEFLLQPEEMYHPKFITYKEYITVLVILLKTCGASKELLQDKDFLDYCRNSFRVKSKGKENTKADIEKNWDSVSVDKSFHKLLHDKLNSAIAQFFTFSFFKHLVYQGVRIELFRYKEPSVEDNSVETLYEAIFYKDYKFVRMQFAECKLSDGIVYMKLNGEHQRQFEFSKNVDYILKKGLDDYRQWVI